jgi:hypothetical protein
VPKHEYANSQSSDVFRRDDASTGVRSESCFNPPWHKDGKATLLHDIVCEAPR